MFPIHDENPSSIIPYVTYSVIGLCIAAFLWQITRDPAAQNAIVYALGVIPSVIFNREVLPPELAWVPPSATVFTSMFLHGGWMHLIGNMLYLWVFGNNVEDAMGHVKYLIFYLLCGCAAVFAQSLPDMNSTIPMIGASGAISGVLGAYLLLYPRSRVTVIIPIFIIIKTLQVPAWVVLILWFAMQLYSSIAASSEGGVAFGAHVGGFVAGMVFVALFKRRDVSLKIPFVHYFPFRARH